MLALEAGTGTTGTTAHGTAATATSNGSAIDSAASTAGSGSAEQANPIYKGEETGRKLSISGVPTGDTDTAADKEAASGEEDDGGRFDWPESCGERVFFVCALPWLCLFTATIPDVANEKWENW